MSEQTNLVVLPDRDALVERATEFLITKLKESIASRGSCSWALAGGSTPKDVYRRIAEIHASEFPWQLVNFYFGDERCVPPDHEHSNFGMAWNCLFDGLPLSNGQVHRMRGELEDREQAAREYEALLPERLDVVMLGMGGDGHTASLFPGDADALNATGRVTPANAPSEPRHRLSLAAKEIENAREVVMLVSGASKQEALRNALRGELDPHRVPAQWARRGTWLVDEESAALL